MFSFPQKPQHRFVYTIVLQNTQRNWDYNAAASELISMSIGIRYDWDKRAQPTKQQRRITLCYSALCHLVTHPRHINKLLTSPDEFTVSR